METFNNLDTSLDTIISIGEKCKNDLTMEEFKNRALTLIEKGRKIVIPEDFRKDLQITEKAAIKNLTFMVERPKYESAMAEVIKALDLLSKININHIPEKSLDNIIKLLLAIYTDCSQKVKNMHETMATMIDFSKDFILLGHTTNTLDAYKNKLEVDIQRMKVNEDKKDTEIKRLVDFADSMHGRKEFYKAQAIENRANLNTSIRTAVDEQNRLKNINQKLVDEMAVTTDRIWEEKQTVTEKEEIRKLRINNQKDVGNLLKDMEEKKTKDGKLIDKLKTNLSQKEKDLKSTTIHLNRLLRDRDEEIKEKEKAYNRLKQMNELFDYE